MRAARYLKVPAWELAARKDVDFWLERALIAEAAEIGAQNVTVISANDQKSGEREHLGKR